MRPSSTADQRGRAREDLLALIRRHLTGPEFADFLRSHDRSEVADAIPPVTDDAIYQRELVLALDRRGLLDAHLLDALADVTNADDEVQTIAINLGIHFTPSLPEAIHALSERLRGNRLDDPDFLQLQALGSQYYNVLVEDRPAERTSVTIKRLTQERTADAMPALGWLARRIYDQADRDSGLLKAAARVMELASAPDTPRPLSPDKPSDVVGSAAMGNSGAEIMVPARFLTEGAAAARSVVLIRFTPKEPRLAMCTGWLLTPSLVVVPGHVFGAYQYGALGTTVTVDRPVVDSGEIEVLFHYDDDPPRTPRPAVLEILEERLDLAVLRLAEPIRSVDPLRIRTDAAPGGSRPISMIHHLGGRVKTVSLHDAEVLENDGHEIVYLAASGPGSAGAPVFDESWRVIGTHRAWRSYRTGDGGVIRAKSGIATPALLRWLRESSQADGRLWREVIAAQPDLKSIDPTLERILNAPGVGRRRPRAPLVIEMLDAGHRLDKVPDLRVDAASDTTVTATGTWRSVQRLVRDPAVLAIETSPTGAVPECWNSIPFVKADRVHAPVESARSELGAGAIVAVIDNGVDILHQAFLDAAGQTRIAAFWDQRDPTVPIGSAGPAHTVSDAGRAAALRWSVNYGALYVREDLQLFVTDQTLPARFPDRRGMRHGTIVASVAVGRRTGEDRETQFGGGVAPEATLLVVRPDPEDEAIGYAKGYIDALNVIDTVATELGLPVVVNISAGMNAGSHDGTSRVEKACQRFLDTGGREGRVIVKSAGNERQRFRHAAFEVPAQAVSTLGWSTRRVPNRSTDAPDVMELWFSGDNSYELRVQPPSGPPSPVIPTAEPALANADEWLANGNRFTTGFTAYHQDNGQGCFRLELSRGRSVEIEHGQWSLEVRAVKIIVSEPIHAWIELNSSRDMAFTTDVTDEITLTVPGTAAHVITVGACSVDEARLVPFPNSSQGPTRGRSGNEKPVIMAPGVGIQAARAGTGDGLDADGFSGTSLAAPHVAGAVALMLAARARSGRPQLNTVQIEAALKRSARYRSNEWNNKTGYGVLDVDALMVELTRIP